VYPLASLLATEQVSLGDVLSIDWDNKDFRLIFERIAGGAPIPMATVQRGIAAGAGDTTGRGETAGGISDVPDAIWSGLRRPSSEHGAPLGGTRANTAVTTPAVTPAVVTPAVEKTGEPKVNKHGPTEPRK
jgi:hypothetical protein